MLLLKKREFVRTVLLKAVEAKPAAGDTPEVIGSPAVAITHRPIGQADRDLAAMAVRRAFTAARAGQNSLEAFGLPAGVELPELDESGAEPVPNGLFAIAICKQVAISWEGVTSDGETLAPLDAPNIAMLFNSPLIPDYNVPVTYGDMFLRLTLGQATLEAAAKNVSTVSLATSGAVETNGASAAAPAANPAPPA